LTVSDTSEYETATNFGTQKLVWIAISDAMSEGKWVFDHGPDKGLPAEGTIWWRNSEPDGGTRENCANMYTNNKQYIVEDISCDAERQAIIEFECEAGQMFNPSWTACVGAFCPGFLFIF
jgi:hypothetical protein